MYAISFRCSEHGKDLPLRRSGSCPIYIIYIFPDDPADNRRWLGIMDLGDGKPVDKPVHNHAQPSAHKVFTKVKEDIEVHVIKNPTSKPKEISKGKKKPQFLLANRAMLDD